MDTISGRRQVLLAIEPADRLSAVSSHLSGLGCRCECVRDVDGLLDAVEREAPLLAVIDLDYHGRCMLELCRAHPRLLTDIPVVFHAMDGARVFDRAVAAIRAGASDVVFSPLDVEKLDRLSGEIHALASIGTTHADRAASSHRAITNGAAVTNGHSRAKPLKPGADRANASVLPLNHSRDRTAQIAGKVTPSSSDLLGQQLYGNSPAMVAIRAMIAEIASMDATVLIHGESGTGKELVATAIHQMSDRRHNRFVPVNMATIPPGLAESTLFGHEKGSFTSANDMQLGWCEAADGGTLFLDEIGEMELSIQPKLLRFLQDSTIQRVGSHTSRRVDARVIAATNRDLRDMVKERRMREDLYFRLHVVPIYIAPLRERVEDIESLATIFLRRAAIKYRRNVDGFTNEALKALQAYSWPGNVRQLENLIERTVIFSRGELVEFEEIPAEVHAEAIFDVVPSGRNGDRAAIDGDGHSQACSSDACGDRAPPLHLSPIQRNERNAIIEALHRVDGHVIDAAHLLGLGQATVYRKIKEYQIPHKRKRRQAPK